MLATLHSTINTIVTVFSLSVHNGRASHERPRGQLMAATPKGVGGGGPR